jgi:hypothetical protein
MTNREKDGTAQAAAGIAVMTEETAAAAGRRKAAYGMQTMPIKAAAGILRTRTKAGILRTKTKAGMLPRTRAGVVAKGKTRAAAGMMMTEAAAAANGKRRAAAGMITMTIKAADGTLRTKAKAGILRTKTKAGMVQMTASGRGKSLAAAGMKIVTAGTIKTPTGTMSPAGARATAQGTAFLLPTRGIEQKKVEIKVAMLSLWV